MSEMQKTAVTWGIVSIIFSIFLINVNNAAIVLGANFFLKLLAIIVGAILGLAGAMIGVVIRDFAAPDQIYTTGIVSTIKTKLFWMIGPQSIGAFVGVILGATALLHGFSDKIKGSFIAGCLNPGVSKSTCECRYDKLEEKYTSDGLRKINLRLVDIPNDFLEVTKKAASECGNGDLIGSISQPTTPTENINNEFNSVRIQQPVIATDRIAATTLAIPIETQTPSTNVQQLIENQQTTNNSQTQKEKYELARYKAKDALDEANKQINIVWNAPKKDIRKVILPEQTEWLKQREVDCGLKSLAEEPNDSVVQETIKLNCMTTMTYERIEVLKQKITSLQLLNNTQMQVSTSTTLDDIFSNFQKCEFNSFFYDIYSSEKPIIHPYFLERNLKPYKEENGVYYFKLKDTLFGLPVSELIIPGTWNLHKVTFDVPLTKVQEIFKQRFGNTFTPSEKYISGESPLLEKDNDNPNKSSLYCEEKEEQ